MTDEAITVAIFLCLGMILGASTAASIMGSELHKATEALKQARKALAEARKNDHRDAKGRFAKAA